MPSSLQVRIILSKGTGPVPGHVRADSFDDACPSGL
jgi:hypothetical protein